LERLIQRWNGRLSVGAVTTQGGGSRHTKHRRAARRRRQSRRWTCRCQLLLPLVLSGSGTAVVKGDETELGPGSLVLIEAGEAHEIRCEGDAPLQTVNVYAPPAY
jgi:oxalate decarboxylase/phosphoglucose isomerase-like protein (cupin superfamily)